MAEPVPRPPPGLANAFERCREALRATGWESRPSTSDGAIVFRPPARHGRSWCVLSFDTESDAVVLHALLPTRCPAPRLEAAAELCMRANRRLAFGRMGVDPDTGDMSFQMAWPECMVGTDVLSFMKTFLTLLEHHTPAMMMVAEAHVAPTVALAGIEASAAQLAWK